MGFIVISHIKVRIGFQRIGVAKLLLASALELAKSRFPSLECRFIYLSVAAVNMAALGLYESLGFTEAKQKRDHEGWLKKCREVEDASLQELHRQWLEMAWGYSTSFAPPSRDLPTNSGRKREASSAFGFSASDVYTSAAPKLATGDTPSRVRLMCKT